MLKYVPLRVGRFFNRVVGGAGFNGEKVSDVFSERDDLRRKYVDLVETIGDARVNIEEIRKVEAMYRANMLLGGLPNLEEDAVGSSGINNVLLDLAKVERRERGVVIKQNEALERKHLEYVVRTICADEKVKRATAVVYCRGEVIYSTDKFEKVFGSAYVLEKFLIRDERLNTDLEMGKRADVEYDGKRLVFVPDRKGKNLISVAYFVPDKREDIVKIFKRVGERAVRVIHDSLRDEKFGELELA